MAAPAHTPHTSVLRRIAERAMVERGLRPAFSAGALAELKALEARGGAPADAGSGIRDLTALLWSSIDNDDSRDLDQLTVAEPVRRRVRRRIRVAVADVDALVAQGSAIDEHARHNTTSVYTAAAIFPMLPERLSTDLTSLNAGQDRLAVVVEMDVDADGLVTRSERLPRPRPQPRQARLQQRGGVARGHRAGAGAPGAPCPGWPRTSGCRTRWRSGCGSGATSTVRWGSKPSTPGRSSTATICRRLDTERKNRATELIEDFMIAANGVTATFLEAHEFPILRRVVRSPRRWDRIVALAGEHGDRLAGRARSGGARRASWRRPAAPTRSAFPTSRWRWSSCSAPANTWSSARAGLRRGTSVWR